MNDNSNTHRESTLPGVEIIQTFIIINILIMVPTNLRNIFFLSINFLLNYLQDIQVLVFL